MTTISDSIYEKFGPDKETALEFFAIFSRFECALKCIECQKKAGVGDGGSISPYWKEYADYLKTKTELSKKIKDAAKYLLDHPPKKQVVGSKRWKDVENCKDEMLDITLKIRRVRNNLFHGGKFISDMGWYNRNHDQELVKTCLKVLYICLEDKNPVTKAFYDDLDLGEYGENDNKR